MQTESELNKAKKCVSFTSEQDDQDSLLQQWASEHRDAGGAQGGNSAAKPSCVGKVPTISDLAVSEDNGAEKVQLQGQSR